MSEDERETVKLALSQLRHAYAHLAAEDVVRQRVFADGLLAPVIRMLEWLTDSTTPLRQR